MSQNSGFIHPAFRLEWKKTIYTAGQLLEEANSQDGALALAKGIIEQWHSGKAIEFQSSGTTSTSKTTVTHNQKVLTASAKRSIDFFGLQVHDEVYLPLSLEFTGGKMALIRAMVGGQLLIVNHPTNEPALPLERELAFGSMVSSQWYFLLSHAEKATINFKKGVLLGGGPVSTTLEKKSKEVSFPVWHGFGSTETASHVAVRRIGESETYLGLRGVTFSQSEDGCLIIHDKALEIDRLETSDLVELVTAKQFRWLGRKDNLIVSGGKKIPAEELEKEIEQIIDTKRKRAFSFFITGLPHEKWGEEVVLFVEKPNYEEGLSKVDEKKISKLPYVKRILYDYPFQRTESGKIKRRQTVEQYLLKRSADSSFE